jgi:hypothetical protein
MEERPNMNKFLLTVGLRYAQEPHVPSWGMLHPDGWCEVQASDEGAAREEVVARFGTQWAFMYPARKEPELSKHNPSGCTAVIRHGWPLDAMVVHLRSARVDELPWAVCVRGQLSVARFADADGACKYLDHVLGATEAVVAKPEVAP